MQRGFRIGDRLSRLRFGWRFCPFWGNCRGIDPTFQIFYGDVFSDYGHGVDLKECVRGVSSGVLENNYRILSDLVLIE